MWLWEILLVLEMGPEHEVVVSMLRTQQRWYFSYIFFSNTKLKIIKKTFAAGTLGA